MKLIILEPAELELKEIVKYYNEQSEGLGFDFVVEFEKTVYRILQYPFAWRKISRNTHKCITNRFPYK